MAVAATIKRTCINCGKAFEKADWYYKSQYKVYKDSACIFCCRECVIEWKKKQYDKAHQVKICEHCGKEFNPLKSLINNETRKGRAKYCSLSCYHDHGRKELICTKCGKKFSVIKCMDNRKYCSQECANVSRNRLIKTCLYCGKDYEIIPSRKKISKCCSFDCLIKYVAELNTKTGLDAKTRCGRKEWRNIRILALKRDDFTCQICGKKDKLVVHHIINWRKTKNDELNNLITLCQLCHWEAHGKKVKKQVAKCS